MSKSNLCNNTNISISDYDRHLKDIYVDKQSELEYINQESRESAAKIDSMLRSANKQNLSIIANEYKTKNLGVYDLNLILQTANILNKIDEGIIDEENDLNNEIDLSKSIYDETTWEAKHIRKVIYEKLSEKTSC